LLEDLFKQGLLKKAAKSNELAAKSLEQSAYFRYLLMMQQPI